MKYFFQNRIVNDDNSGEWFCPDNADTLFFHDFRNDELKTICRIPHFQEKNALFGKEIKYKNILYFPHRHAGRVSRFDVKQNIFLEDIVFEEIEELMKRNEQAYPLGFNSALFNGKLFFVNRSFSMAMLWDSEKEKYEIICSNIGVNSYWLSGDYIVNNQFLIAPMYDCNGISVLDMKKKSLEIIKLGDDSSRFFAVSIDVVGKYYILEGTQSKLYELDIKERKLTFLSDVLGMNCTVHQPYSLYYHDECIYIVPFFDWFGDNIRTWLFSKKTKEMICRDSFSNYEFQNKFLACEDDGMLGYFFVPHGDDVFCSDKLKYIQYDYVNDGIVEKEHSKYDSVYLDEILREYRYRVAMSEIHNSKNKSALFENQMTTLDIFIAYVNEIELPGEAEAK